MNYTCSNTVIKYLMFVINFIFVITGIIILGVGVSVKSHYYDYELFLDNQYFSLPNMLIATGSLIFFISFLGCYGAMRENWMLLMAFSVCLTIIFIFELSVGIAGYVLRDKTSDYLESKLSESMKQYDTSSIGNMWDVIQTEFECCGVRNYTDWQNTFDNYSLPVSCCPKVSGTVGVFYCNAFPLPTTPTTASTESTPTTKATEPTESTTKATEATESTTVATESTTVATESTTKATEATTESTAATPPEGNKNAQSLVKAEGDDTTTAAPTTPGYPPSSSNPFRTGCERAFGNFVKTHAVDIGAVGIALAVIQLFGIALSFHMARQLKNGYYST